MKLKTFFVEDNATIRDNLVDTLEELTPVQSVGFAESESAAVQWFADSHGDWNLAIVDLFLADGSGLGVLQAVLDRPSDRKVIVLSNYATPAIRQRCMALGADAVFDKSNELEALMDFCSSQRPH